MALVNVKQAWSRQNFDAAIETNVAVWRASAARLYTVLYDSVANDNTIAALVANDGSTAIPAYSAPWSAGSVTYMTVVRKRVEGVTPYLFQVLVEFAGKSSPLLDPAHVWWGGVKNLEQVDYDAAGVRYKNVLGQPINNVRRPIYDRVVRWSRNEADDAFAASSSYRGTLNSANVTVNGRTIAAGTGLLDSIEAERLTDGQMVSGYYWNVTYVIQVRTGGWKRQECNKGTHYWDGTYSDSPTNTIKTLKLCTLDDGITPTVKRLTATGALLTPDSAADVKLEFDDYAEASWSAIGFT